MDRFSIAKGKKPPEDKRSRLEKDLWNLKELNPRVINLSALWGYTQEERDILDRTFGSMSRRISGISEEEAMAIIGSSDQQGAEIKIDLEDLNGSEVERPSEVPQVTEKINVEGPKGAPKKEPVEKSINLQYKFIKESASKKRKPRKLLKGV
jgi:hypothetical protein